MISLNPDETGKEKHGFVLNEVVKRKILDMYNISTEDASPKTESEKPANNDEQE